MQCSTVTYVFNLVDIFVFFLFYVLFMSTAATTYICYGTGKTRNVLNKAFLLGKGMELGKRWNFSKLTEFLCS